MIEDAYLFRCNTGTDHNSMACVWPTDVDAADLCTPLSDLGTDALAFLDYLMYHLNVVRGIDTALGSPREWEALTGLGIAHIDDVGGAELTVQPATLREALSNVVSDLVDAHPDYARITERLYVIERLLRRELRKSAVSQYGAKWRGQVLNSHVAAEVVKRAADEFRSPPSVKGLRDPLEWLSIAELLQLVEDARWAGRLGQRAALWRKFRGEVVPIRNRASHMRLVRRGDLETVEGWRVVLARVFR